MSRHESVDLGTLIKEPIIVEGRPISRKIIAIQNKGALGTKVSGMLGSLKLPQNYAPEVVMAFKLMWRSRAKGATRPQYLRYAIYIVARSKGLGENVPDDLISSGLMGSTTRPGRFVLKAVKAAQDAGIPVTRINHERALLRAVDELRLDRSYYHAAAKLAKTFSCGADPRTKFGLALHHLSPISLTRVAAALGMSRASLSSARFDARKRGDIA
ncbi:MAG: hypothetical protein JRN09_09240 [Nitrososphaerota archaeon]|nr:hypothetical protein [Nitrososphaerota archaeon]